MDIRLPIGFVLMIFAYFMKRKAEQNISANYNRVHGLYNTRNGNLWLIVWYSSAAVGALGFCMILLNADGIASAMTWLIKGE